MHLYTLCSGNEHMKVDVDAVHKRICHLLAIIRTESEAPPFVSIQQADVLDKERKNQQLVCGLVYSSEKTNRKTFKD